MQLIKGFPQTLRVQERAKTLLQKQSESVDTSKAKRQQQCLLPFDLLLFILWFYVYLLFRLIFITIFCDMIWPTFKSSKRQPLQRNFLDKYETRFKYHNSVGRQSITTTLSVDSGRFSSEPSICRQIGRWMWHKWGLICLQRNIKTINF